MPVFGDIDVLMHRTNPLTPALSPRGGEGEREQIFMLFKPEFDPGITGRCISPITLGQFPLPPGEG